ncbi:AAA family ATPase [Leifsonia poae]|uniref:AAA family ATPase n=1 Tax=Leifsonia poae TaxID=110933 RepID=UPI003D6662E0
MISEHRHDCGHRTDHARSSGDRPSPAKPPTWLARGFLPRGEIAVLVGEEGIGKSLTWVVMVAHITTGAPFKPFNIPKREPQDVVLIITEDSWAEVSARLTVAGADMARVHLMSEADDGSGTPIFPEHMPPLLEAIEAEAINPALIVVDAWLDTVEAGLQVRNTQHGRQALAPWKATATQLDATVLLITHTNRMDTANTRDLLGSTVALRQKARMILFAARAPHDGENGTDTHVWIGPEKSNTTGVHDAVRFTINIEQHRLETDDDPGTVATLINASSAGASIKQLLQEWRDEQQADEHTPTQPEKAEQFVRDYMLGKEIVLANEVHAAAQAAGYGQKAVRTAMKNIGTSRPASPGAPWLYSLHTQSRQSTATTFKSTDTAQTAETGLFLTSHGEKTSKTTQTDTKFRQFRQSEQTWNQYAGNADTGANTGGER